MTLKRGLDPKLTPSRRVRRRLVAASALVALSVVAMLSVRHFAARRAEPDEPGRQADRAGTVPLRPGLDPEAHLTVSLERNDFGQALRLYGELTGRQLLGETNSVAARADELLHGQLSRLRLVSPAPAADAGLTFHHDGLLTAAQLKESLEEMFRTNGLRFVPVGRKFFRTTEARGQEAR